MEYLDSTKFFTDFSHFTGFKTHSYAFIPPPKMTSQRELARMGRMEQMHTLKQFEAGMTVIFKVSNNPKGFRLVSGGMCLA